MMIVIAAITTIRLTLDPGISNPSQNTGYRRATRNTPATTIVEECSSDDTGVGPAIASGNQVWSGNWPLLPMHAANMAIAAHSSTVWLGSPDSAHAEMPLMLNPDTPRFSWVHEFDAKYRIAVPHSRPTSPTLTVKNAFERGAGIRFVLPPVADEQERAEPHDLPAEDQLDHVLGEDHHEHAGGEQGDRGEEVRVAAVAAHVLERIDLHEQ